MQDICEARHGGNEESRAAFESVEAKIRNLQAQILRFIYDQKGNGATSKEISRALKIPYTTVAARRSELLKLGLIAKNGERREGAAVVTGNIPLYIGGARG